MASTNLRDDAPAKPKKIYPRKLTDKRREQNRQAQKSYRERQKRRIEELEKKVEEKNSFTTAPSTSDFPTGVTTTDSAQDLTAYEATTADPQPSTRVVPNITFEPFEIGDEVPGPTFGDFELDIRGSGELTGLNEQAQTFTFDESALLPSSVEDNATGLWPSPPITEPLDTSLTWDETELGQLASQEPANAYFNKEAVVPVSTSNIMAPTPSYSNAPSPGRDPADPAFMENSLTFSSVQCVNALFEIAACLGITRESYVNDHQSPFYRPAILNATCAPINAIARIEADSYTYLKPDLRPSTTQIIFPHESYLDCIIWPRFRERALRAAIEGKIDHMELFMDVINDGLVCWGNQQNQKGKGMSRGVAWDQRSWEARPWFIKKWSWLVGDEDDDVVRGSKWWRFMRGEKD